jgi:hypothetical protein
MTASNFVGNDFSRTIYGTELKASLLATRVDNLNAWINCKV